MKSIKVKKYYVSEIVGVCFKKYRTNKGLSLTEVANAIGISQQHLSRYENGKSAINVDILIEILSLLDVKIYDFYFNFFSLLLEKKHLSQYITDSDKINWKLKLLKNHYKAESII